MTLKEALAKLEALGNETVRAMNIKNGLTEEQFGVKLGDIRTVANSIKSDHTLALSLWDSGNIDAKLLATLVIKPKQLSPDEMDKMVKSIKFNQVADWFNANVVKEYPDREKLREKWLAAKEPMALRAGWSLTAGRVARSPEGLDIAALLDRIEKEMPKSAPEVQWTMNTTLAYIGIHFPIYRSRAISMGEKMGIFRDYPVSKGCTSPFAPIWIKEMVSRQ